MAIDKKTLGELKEKLLSEKKRLEVEIEHFAKSKEKEDTYETSFNQIGTDREDNASEVEEYSDNLALENSLEKSLKDTNEALEEMEKGTYGICKNCKQEINIERLRVFPSARTCIKCK
jgi:RNA polymerase-binding protein DksA